MSKYQAWCESHLQDVRQVGLDEVVALCPFHQDSNPSMAVNVRKGVFICRACGAAGNMKKLSDHLGIGLNVKSSLDNVASSLSALRTVVPETTRVYPEEWLDQFDNDTDYWHSRGLSSRVCRKFRLGFDIMGNAGTIPLRNAQGQVLGVVRRQLRDLPRYLYPKGYRTSMHLWGLWKVTGKSVAITEGSLDAVALWDVGIPAVALMGSSMSKMHAKALRLSGIKVVTIMTDRDRAGQKAADSVQEMLTGLTIKRGEYRDNWKGSDPASLSPRQRQSMYNSAQHVNRLALAGRPR